MLAQLGDPLKRLPVGDARVCSIVLVCVCVYVYVRGIRKSLFKPAFGPSHKRTEPLIILNLSLHLDVKHYCSVGVRLPLSPAKARMAG